LTQMEDNTTEPTPKARNLPVRSELELAQRGQRKRRPQEESSLHIAWPVWALIGAAVVTAAGFGLHSLLSTPPVEILAGLRDGGREISLTSEGRLRGVPVLSTEDTTLLLTVLTTHKLPEPLAPQSPGNSSPMDAAPASLDAPEPQATFTLVAPLSEFTLPAPQFRWLALPGATSYQVFVYDQSFKISAQSPPLTQLTWTVNRSLPPGESYSWVVKAATPSGTVQSPLPPAPNGRFSVVDAGVVTRIAAAQSLVPPSHLLLAAIYQRSGMTTFARTEMEELHKENPDSAFVRELEDSLPPMIP
jgi:hypothetical protein